MEEDAPLTYIPYFWSYIHSMIENYELKSFIAFMMTYLSTFFGVNWWIIQMLFILIFCDFVMGFIAGVKTKGQISLAKMHHGILKFLAYAVTIVMVLYMEEMVKFSVHLEIPLLALYATYQCVTEMSSIAKHLLILGLPLPQLFVKLLVKSRDKIDDTIDDALKTDKEFIGHNGSRNDEYYRIPTPKFVEK